MSQFGVFYILVICSVYKTDYIFQLQSQVGLEIISMNKASGGDGLSVKLFQVLKEDAVKVPICQQI